MEEWGPNGAEKNSASKKNGRNPEDADDTHVGGGLLGSVLLSAKLSEHVGARVWGRGGLVDVFFVCDGDVNKGSRIKHVFSQVGVLCLQVCVCM